MHTFQIPVRRFPAEAEIFATVNVEDEDLVEHARHGLDQRINDATAGLKRKDFATEELWAEAVVKKVNGVVDRIHNGTFRAAGRRGPADPKLKNAKAVIAALGEVTPEEMEIIKRMRESGATWSSTPTTTE